MFLMLVTYYLLQKQQIQCRITGLVLSVCGGLLVNYFLVKVSVALNINLSIGLKLFMIVRKIEENFVCHEELFPYNVIDLHELDIC